MTSTVVELQTRAPVVATRLLVTVRDPGTRQYRSVGFLGHENDRFSFAYLRRELARDGFRPLPGLARAVDGPLQSASLFPLFAERVISSRRPDRQLSLDALGLPADAAPMQVLARSQGQRVGDTIELLPASAVGIGERVAFTFLTHGVRYLPQSHQDRITTLVPGEPLRFRADPANEVNPRAQLVTDFGDIQLGWLPDPLIDVVEAIDEQRLSVERANGPDVGFHFRLLARLEGRVGERGLFIGSDWETA